MEYEIHHKIEAMIFNIRGQKVMLDSDLSKLYGVETKVLNQAVKRNADRFPEDFMFVPNSSELATLRSQIVTLDTLNSRNYTFKYSPKLFTENGVAMLSSVISSKKAIQVNITIMRTFTKMRSFLVMDNNTNQRLNKFEEGTNKLFKIVFDRLNTLENQTPNLSSKRKKIGLKK